MVKIFELDTKSQKKTLVVRWLQNLMIEEIALIVFCYFSPETQKLN